jgi:hypothetical protein
MAGKQLVHRSLGEGGCGHLKAASQGKIRNKIWFEKEVLISPA